MKKILFALMLATTATLSLSACTAPEKIDVSAANAMIIDVRTPAEYSEGHLDGAVNMDVQDPSFTTLLESLPTDGEYVVYCRSGNRSAQAVAQMKASGFTNVIDAGGVQSASSATGLPIVQ